MACGVSVILSNDNFRMTWSSIKRALRFLTRTTAAAAAHCCCCCSLNSCKRGVCDSGRLDDYQSPAKALRPDKYDLARRLKFIRPIMRDQADVHTDATFMPPKLESSIGSACEESPDSLMGRHRLPWKLLIKSAAVTPRLQCLFYEVYLSYK